MKRLFSLLCFPLLIIGLTGYGFADTPTISLFDQTQWLGAKILPDMDPVIPLEDILPEGSEDSTESTPEDTSDESETPSPENAPDEPETSSSEDTPDESETSSSEDTPDESETSSPENTPDESDPPSSEDTPDESEAPSSENAPDESEVPSSEDVPREPEDDALVRVLDYIPEIRQALAYASADNLTGQRIYDFADAYLRYGTVKKLAAACEELATLDLGILIWDAFRPLDAQEALWEICPDETYVSHPATGCRSHCRGNAVDITLVDLRTGEAKPVPTEYDDFSDLADRDYSDCAPEGALYAILLENIMTEHGFEPYFEQWWHFTDSDEYPVEEAFHPTLPGTWTANCSRRIGVFKTPYSTEAFGYIYAGESMNLLGWNEKYAKISYNGVNGYVMSSYIKPQDEDYFANCLDIVAPDASYSYEQMLLDVDALQAAYPDIVTVESIGFSELERNIPVLRIGSEDAEYHVLFQGAMHGREHMTAWLLMAVTDYWLRNDILSYGNICYHIIPMSNPDGVTISQEASLSGSLQKIYQSDRRLGYTRDPKSEYARLWKANGLGEDINRNFPDGWKNIHDREAPSSMNYPGKAPFSTAEAQALRDYTLAYNFDVTISYHATGSLIYYEYGNKRSINNLCKSLGRAVEAVSGYPLVGSSSTDGAGYKDWAIHSLEIPSLTIEIGCQQAPLEERELYSVFARNYRVLPAIADWLQK